jgi:hypothetical protein
LKRHPQPVVTHRSWKCLSVIRHDRTRRQYLATRGFADVIIGQLAQRGIIPASNARLRFGTAGALAVGILNERQRSAQPVRAIYGDRALGEHRHAPTRRRTRRRGGFAEMDEDVAHGRCQRGDRGAQRCVEREHAEVAVAVKSRRRHQSGDPIDQLHGGEKQRAGPARAGLGDLIAQAFGTEFAQPVQGERWPGAVPEQTPAQRVEEVGQFEGRGTQGDIIGRSSESTA